MVALLQPHCKLRSPCVCIRGLILSPKTDRPCLSHFYILSISVFYPFYLCRSFATIQNMDQDENKEQSSDLTRPVFPLLNSFLFSTGVLDPPNFHSTRALHQLGDACELPPCYLRVMLIASEAGLSLEEAAPKRHSYHPSQLINRVILLPQTTKRILKSFFPHSHSFPSPS